MAIKIFYRCSRAARDLALSRVCDSRSEKKIVEESKCWKFDLSSLESRTPDEISCNEVSGEMVMESGSPTDLSRFFISAAVLLCLLAAAARFAPFLDVSWLSVRSVVVSQGIVVINMLGWVRFAHALTGARPGRSRTGEGLSFAALKCAALCGAILWIARTGIEGLSYLCAGAVAQLAGALLLTQLSARPARGNGPE